MRNFLKLSPLAIATLSLALGLTALAEAQTPLTFVPVTPCRVADTRNAAGPFGAPNIPGGTSRNFTIPSSACSIPSTAQAYSLNVAVVPQGPLGYLTIWPAGQTQPFVATLNSDGRVKSNAAIVPAGTAGAVSVFASNSTDVIIDINGYFIPASSANTLAFYPVTPCRIADTRSPNGALAGPFIAGGTARAFPIQSSTCNIPATAQAYSLNLAAVPRGSLGYLTAWPTGQTQPLAASLNAVTGTVTANAAVVPAGTAGSISVFASNDTDLVIDTNGYFAPAGGAGALALYNVTPCRAADTRLPAGTQPFTGLLNLNVSGSSCAPPLTAQSYVFNATVVPSGSFGYLTLFGHSTTQPVVATLNAVDGVVAGNLAIVPTNDGSITAFASNATQLVVDLFAYFAPIGNAPVITDFSPKSGPAGMLITLTGTGLGSSTVSLLALGGGTIAAPVLTNTSTGLTFFIPAGAATGPVTVTAAGVAGASASALTVTPASSFTISAAPASANLIMGQSVSYAIQMSSPNGFSQVAPLSITGLPAGVTASFKPAGITAGQTSILTLTAPATQPAGPAALSISAGALVDGIPVSQTAPASVTVQAPTTSFLGRTVAADSLETPLTGVVVSLVGQDGSGNNTGCAGTVTTDGGGNFALTNLPPSCIGPQLVSFAGNHVTSPTGVFTSVQLVYTLVSGKVVVSPILVHLPRLDNAETISVKQNSLVDQTITFKTIPGFSVVVYAGTTLSMPDGTRPDPFPLAAVEIPLDRLPEVNPASNVMVNAFIVGLQPDLGVASSPIAIFYPNTAGAPAGTNVPLMALDSTRGRMVPYGSGTISSNGMTIIPDLDPASALGHRFGVTRLDWSGPSTPPPNQINPSPDPCSPTSPNPVDLSSGVEVITNTDFAISGPRGVLDLVRTYRTLSNSLGPFGYGTSHNIGFKLTTADGSFASPAAIVLIPPDGNQISFPVQPDGTWRNTTVAGYRGAIISRDSNGVDFNLHFKEGRVIKFGLFITNASVIAFIDNYGNTTTVTHDPALKGNPTDITAITDPRGNSLMFTYNVNKLISSIQDSSGRMVRYAYTADFHLSTVTYPNGATLNYTYDPSTGALLKIIDERGLTIIQNSYFDASSQPFLQGRVSRQVQADGGVWTYSYTSINPLIPYSPINSTTVTNPVGAATVYRFNAAGVNISVTDPAGQTRTSNVQSGTNLVLSRTGPGRCSLCGDSGTGDVTYTYDNLGNRLTKTDALGNMTKITYDPVFNKPATITDALGNVTRIQYDSHGSVISVTGPKGEKITLTYNSFGEVTTYTDPTGATLTAAYDGSGNPVSMTSPSGQISRLVYDSLSRLIEAYDPGGAKFTTSYDAVNRIVSETDPGGATVKHVYDANQNLTIVYPSGKSTSFVYDSMNRLSTVTDAAGKTESYVYDSADRLTQYTDRRGMISRFTYDALDRPVTEIYQDGSTVKKTYDANSNVTRVEDSVGGTIVHTYDSLSRLLSTVNQFGTVNYTYDALGRVVNEQVQGQPQVSYSYDNSGQVTKISSPSASFTYALDVAGRVTGLTRSNGVSSTVGFDPLGRINTLAHAAGASLLNQQSYTYDSSGGYASIVSDLAKPLATVSSTAVYDAANRLTAFNTTTYQNDAAGNRISETGPAGTTTYTWDARNRLSSIQAPGGVTTSLLYDAEGNLIQRRQSSTGSDVTQSYILDDLSNVLYQKDSTGQQTSFLNGRSLDENLAFTNNAGVQFPLTDLRNNTVAITDSGGKVVAQLSYEAFGLTSTTGVAAPFEFAGRNRLTSNLYYNRARVYDSTTFRFLSEDPLGLGTGDTNLYRYGLNDPISHTDPTGRFVVLVPVATAIVGGVTGAIGYLGGVAITDYLNPNAKSSFDVKKLGIATSVGVAAGAAAPATGALLAATLVGAASNVLQQLLDNLLVDHVPFDCGLITSAATGFVGGAIGGKFAQSIKFGPRRTLYQGIANANRRQTIADAVKGSVLRGNASSIFTDVDVQDASNKAADKGYGVSKQ